MSNGDLENRIEVVGEDLDSITLRVPRAVLESEILISLKKAENTPEDRKKILKLEQLAFTPEEGGTQDPPETPDGIEKFLDSGGIVYLLSRYNGFMEKIPLEKMLDINYTKLNPSSPLRQVSEKDVLQKARSDYSEINKELWYIHGVGTAIKKLSDGSRLTNYGLKVMLNFLADEQVNSDDKIHFGYIDVGPQKDNINIPSFKMFFKLGAVADSYANEVYEEGIPYLRIVHGAGYTLDKKNKKRVNLSYKDYLTKIINILEEGYIGKELTFSTKSKTYSMVFYKQINK